MAQYRDDPRWITVKYQTRCARCADNIKPGREAFWYPRTKAMYCQSDSCGGMTSRDFYAHAFDEEVYASQ